MEQQQNIIITDSLSGIGTEAYKGYQGHALCLDGMCHIMFNGKELEMKRGNLMIVRQGKLVQSVKTDSRFRVIMIYIAAPFIKITGSFNGIFCTIENMRIGDRPVAIVK